MLREELAQTQAHVAQPGKDHQDEPDVADGRVETVVISVGQEDVLVQGQIVARVNDILEGQPDTMVPLTARLAELRDSIVGPSTLTVAETQEITILADKSVPFIVVRKIMSTCTDEGYENVSLAVIQKPTQVASR
jgi:biopolymer transport protein ExbD